MGRKRLLPNINNLLLQLHLPHRSSNTSSNTSSSNSSNNNNGSTRKQQHDDDGTYHENDHHRHHVFTWPSLKRKPSTSSLASVGTEDDYSTTEAPTSQKSLSLTASMGSATPYHHRSNSSSSSVSFGTCEVRIYSQVLGDHPCCSEGCPVQLGWKYQTEELVEVDEYECHHQNTVLHELRLTPEERRKIIIFAKQQQYVNSSINNSNNNNNSNTASAACGIPASHGEGCGLEESLDSMGPVPANNTPDNNEPPPAMSDVQHERELRRECRRLNRCNINVKASRKRNKRTQQAFFGTTTTKTRTTTTTTTISAPRSDAPARSGRE